MKKWMVIVGMLAVSSATFAEVFILNFEGDIGTFIDDKTAGIYSITQNNVTLEVTLAAYGTAGADEFNLTGDGFGINNSASGDDTDAFDDNEYMTLSFNHAGTFQTLELDRMTGSNGDDGSLGFEGGFITNFTGSITTMAINQSFVAGQLITLSQTTGGSGATWGFGLETMTIDVVPEPLSISLFSIAGVGLFLVRRFLFI